MGRLNGRDVGLHLKYFVPIWGMDRYDRVTGANSPLRSDMDAADNSLVVRSNSFILELYNAGLVLFGGGAVVAGLAKLVDAF